MAIIKKVFHSVRKFVNLPGSDDTGSVQAEIAWMPNRYREKEEDDQCDGYMQYTLKFTDCTRSIDFNISSESTEERENSIHKVEELISALKGFRNNLTEAFKYELYMKELANEKSERKRKELEKELNEQQKEK